MAKAMGCDSENLCFIPDFHWPPVQFCASQCLHMLAVFVVSV